ncbi:MAG: SEC-C metal-binding domain-containing protein, partial [bacterium]|nr:SEC-C metal-binding domain-containing protein [bacterium]
GRDKYDTLPAECRACAWLRLCHGGCPKHRFLPTAAGHSNLNYLCAGYKKFYAHTAPHLRVMADLLARQQAPANIMQLLATQEHRTLSAPGAPARNAACPCGSGKKYKLCCAK